MNETLTVDQAFKFVQSLLKGRKITDDVYKEIFKGLWEGEKNPQLVTRFNNKDHDLKHIDTYYVPKLKELLQSVLGKDLNRNNLKELVEREWNKQKLGVYVERRGLGDSQSLEEKCYEAIKQRGMIIRIKGPEKMGKSMLMEKIFQKAKEAKYQIVLLSFGEPTYEVISSYDKFLFWFCQRTTEEIDIDEIDAKKYWETENESDLNTKCRKYFYKNILPKIDENSALVLGLHRVDRIFPFTFASDFFSMLRAWYDSKGSWGKLRLVLAHSTECYVKMDVEKSPFNVGEPVMLDEFDYEQVKELIAQYTAKIDDKNIKNLMSQIGGHPYLLSKIIPDLKINPQKYKEDDFFQPIKKVCKPYLDSLWDQLNEPSELSQAMCQALKDLLEGKQLSEVDDKKVLFLLDSIGLVIEDTKGHKTIRNDLYRQYLKIKLYP